MATSSSILSYGIWAGLWLLWPIEYNGSDTVSGSSHLVCWNTRSWISEPPLTNLRSPCYEEAQDMRGHIWNNICHWWQPESFQTRYQICEWRASRWFQSSEVIPPAPPPPPSESSEALGIWGPRSRRKPSPLHPAVFLTHRLSKIKWSFYITILWRGSWCSNR